MGWQRKLQQKILCRRVLKILGYGIKQHELWCIMFIRGGGILPSSW